MRKVILIAIMFIAFANTISAQDEETEFRDRLTLGAKIGTNYSNVFDTKGEKFEADPKFGLAWGGFMGIPIGKYLGIQPEVLYSRKGFQATGTYLGSPYTLTRTTTYIDVPIFITFKPIKELTLMGGPQYSYLTKQRDVFTNSFTSSDQEREFETSNFRRNILSFSFGADLNVGHIVFGARTAADVQMNNGDGTATTPRYKNAWYQFTIGYRFSAD